MLKVLLIVAALVPISILMPIWLNSVPIFEEPGAGVRLKTYFSTNTMKTDVDHAFPELRPSQFDVTREQMFQILRASATELGWEIAEQASEKAQLHFVVTSTLWRFKDDVLVTVIEEGDQVELDILSKSRKGRGDFGANLGHISRLLRLVNEKVSP